MNETMTTTSPWIAHLTQSGACFDAQQQDEILHFGDAQTATTTQDNFVAPLVDQGLVKFTGEDAATFLHGQLTNDVTHLDPLTARLGGYCTAKGRLLATCLYWKSAQDITLELPKTLLPSIAKRLQMFIMRAKAKPADVSAEYAILGLVGQKAITLAQQFFQPLPTAPFAKVDSQAGTLIRLPDAGELPRFQWIAPLDIAISAWPIITDVLTPVGNAAWRLTEITAGIPHITAATQEQFVPQMINYELIGGVNFKKGCYPGQEIVARSQYLGKLKRRTTLATMTATSVIPGQEVFSSADPEQPCGMVVNAERSSATEFLALIEIKLAALTSGTVHLGSASGAQLHFSALPYDLTEPV
jgi:folate-binding protein YgfZ